MLRHLNRLCKLCTRQDGNSALGEGTWPNSASVTAFMRTMKTDGWHVPQPDKDKDLHDKKYVRVRGGKGGSGNSAVITPRPNSIMASGGNGGAGGDVVLIADSRIRSGLSNVRASLQAQSGGNGGSDMLVGATGRPMFIRVPLGTTVKLLDKVFARKPRLKEAFQMQDVATRDPSFRAGVDPLPEPEVDTSVSVDYLERHHLFAEHRRREQRGNISRWQALGQQVLSSNPAYQLRQVRERDDRALVISDLCEDGESIVIARGGRGGHGNAEFANKLWGPASRWSEEGGQPEDVLMLLELKLIADVALVGFPNVGKSSLLRGLTAADPRVADYAFTTLKPQLGRLHGSADSLDITLADMPGLVEGAHEDRGLGHEFLRHVERTKAIAFVLDISRTAENLTPAQRKSSHHAHADAWTQYQQLVSELAAYNASLLQRPVIIVLNKADQVPDASVLAEDFKQKLSDEGQACPPVVVTSAAEASGLQELEDALMLAAQTSFHADDGAGNDVGKNAHETTESISIGIAESQGL